MAYSAPRTWTPGEYPTAAQLNQDLRDNVAFLANPPACRVTKAAFQGITTATNTAIVFDTERYDTDSMHDTVTNNTRITIVTAGLYEVGGCIEWDANAAGTRSLGIRLNGTTFLVNVFMDIDSAILHAQNVETTYKFAAADYVELVAWQDSGGSRTANKSGNYSPEFWATWKGLG